MKKILHICTDEKFIDFAINNFNSISNVDSEFYIITSNSLKYVKNKDVIVQSKWMFLIHILLGKFNSFDSVIFHSLTNLFKLYIMLFSKKKKICWIGLGFDYYELKSNYKHKKSKIFFERYFLNSAYKRIDYFCPVLESEFKNVVNRLNLNAKYINWNYGSSDGMVELLREEKINGNSILLGNSAAETNNHFEIIDFLIEKNEKREVIIPLSYGNIDYSKRLISKLKHSKLNYTILSDYLTQKEYFEILKRCAFVIMNHTRQQAAGNILVMLTLGAKVFLDKENPLFDYFVGLGFKVYEKSSLKSELDSFLQSKYIISNKSMSANNFNNKITREKTKRLISKLISNIKC